MDQSRESVASTHGDDRVHELFRARPSAPQQHLALAGAQLPPAVLQPRADLSRALGHAAGSRLVDVAKEKQRHGSAASRWRLNAGCLTWSPNGCTSMLIHNLTHPTHPHHPTGPSPTTQTHAQPWAATRAAPHAGVWVYL